MIGAAVVAMDHDLAPALVTLVVGLGIPLSFLPLPAWTGVLAGFARAGAPQAARASAAATCACPDPVLKASTPSSTGSCSRRRRSST